MQVETVKIQTKASAENPTGVVIINKEDFNSEVHVLFKEDEKTPEPTASLAVAAVPADAAKK